MKLIDLLKEDEELTCWDTDYDCEFYMYKPTDEHDNYDQAILALARCVDVAEVKPDGVVLKVSELLEKNLKREEFQNLFINPDIDDIMDDWDRIMAGYASDSWYGKFAKVVQ